MTPYCYITQQATTRCTRRNQLLIIHRPVFVTSVCIVKPNIHKLKSKIT